MFVSEEQSSFAGDQGAGAERTGHSVGQPLPKQPGTQGTELNGLARCRQMSQLRGLNPLEREW